MRPINLLPPEAFERAASRRTFVRLALVGLAYVLVLGLLVVWWNGRVSSKENEVAQRRTEVTTLQGRVGELSGVQDLVTEYDANVGLITQALAFDLSWGRILNDLGRIIPDRVWLESFAGAVEPTLESGALGSLAVSGFGFDYPDVSSWLRSLDSDTFPGVRGTWVQSVAASQIGEVDVVTFSSSTSLTPAAISQRILERIPVVIP